MDQVAFQNTFFSIAVISAVLLFIAGMWVFYSRRHESKLQAFGAVITASFLWIISLAFYTRSTDPALQLFLVRVLYAVGTIIPMALLWLAGAYFARPAVFRQMTLPLGLAALSAVWFSFGYQLVPFLNGRHDAARLVLTLYFTVFAVAALTAFVLASRNNRHLDQAALTAVVFGAVLVISTSFNLMFAGDFSPVIEWLAVVFMVAGLGIMIVFVADLALLVDLRLVGAEILVIMTMAVFMADLVASADNPLEFAFRLAVFILLIALAALMTRNLFLNVRRLHHNEELREQIIRINGRLIEADRQKTKFVSFVAHQLRSPLTGIRVYLDMARNGQFGEIPAELDQVLVNNIDALDRLLKTTQTFLDVTKIELGKVDLVKVPVAPYQLVARVAKEVEPLAQRKGLVLKTEVNPTLPPIVCDPTYIFHALANLVDNAIKYTEHGQVTVHYAVDHGEAVFTVTDTGIGLADKDRDSLFGIFERGVSVVNLESKGEGLGLYIIKQFVEAHGGRVFFESPGRGHGSTFGFRLPLKDDRRG